jgi:hypothetical protein
MRFEPSKPPPGTLAMSLQPMNSTSRLQLWGSLFVALRRLSASLHRSQSGPARLVLTEEARAVLPDLQVGFDRLSIAFERLKASRGRL